MAKIYASPSPEITDREIRHMKLSREVAGECIVLLENDGTLPLRAGGRLALFGNGAGYTVKGGTGSGDVNTRSNVSVEEGLKEAGYEITTGDWLARQRKARDEARSAYTGWVSDYAAKNNMSEFLVGFSYPFSEIAPVEISDEDISRSETDTAVYVIARNSGEGADRYNRRGDYLLYQEEIDQLKLLGQAYDKLVLVLNIGGVMDMSEVKEIPGVNSVVLMSQLGNIGGLALADVLSGRVTPSGKLTDTWAARYEDYPSSAGFSHNDGNVDDEYYTEGIYVGYRYFDTFGVKPIYSFGYGKSYTEFDIRIRQVTASDGQVKVTAEVTNTGHFSGKEVVQVYYSAPRGSLGLDKPFQELAAFAKTGLLAPGDTETLEISFAAKDMASYSEKLGAWVLEAGDYVIRAGNSSRSAEAVAVLTLDETVKILVTRNLFPDSHHVEEIAPPAASSCGSGTGCASLSGSGGSVSLSGSAGLGSLPAGCSRVHLSAADIASETAVYQGKRREYTTDKTQVLTMADVKAGRCTIEELTAQLTVEELASLCVGTLRADGGSLVGNASYMVPGAAGDTSAVILESRGVKNMILADGPAGLRLQPIFKTTKDGKLLPGGNMQGDFMEPFDSGLKEDETDTYYQYCTAIPIGWALAQSWNLKLLYEAGSMIGSEMELFGVDLWLAPAMNIHRNPLCGRNFEYYSEDPYVSGKAAAAITEGVQSHRGKGTTIKHFAANNQEDNRYFTNSHISERALREIYLKGFEIAVREAQPLSIMTSYNLLNGIHTANNYDLIQSAARDEWGFKGVVMTDWFTSQDQPALTGSAPVIYPISASTGCVCAGNDMQMPGCQKNVDDLVEAVRTGKEIDGYRVTLADLQFNAANMLRVVEKTMA